MESFYPIISITPLLLGVVLTQVLKLNLKGFLGVYLMLVALNVAIPYFYLESSFVAPLVIGAIGAVVMVLLTGIFGTQIRTSDYALAGVGVGLFPWLLSIEQSLVYAVVFIGFAFLVALKPKFKNPLRRMKR